MHVLAEGLAFAPVRSFISGLFLNLFTCFVCKQQQQHLQHTTTGGQVYPQVSDA